MMPMKTYQLKIKNLDCADCAAKLEKGIAQLPGISRSSLDFMSATLAVEFDETMLTTDAIRAAVADLGYDSIENSTRARSVIEVKGMDCAEEAGPIEMLLKKKTGVHDIQFNLVSHTLTVTHTCPVSEIQKSLKNIGFDSALSGRTRAESPDSFWQRNARLLLTASAGILTLVAMGLDFLGISRAATIPLFAAAIISVGFHFASKGFREAKQLTLGMNFLMTLAVIGAMILGEWSEAAMVSFLFSLAQVLESYTLDRARRSIQSLMELAPDLALLKTENGNRVAPAETVGVNDVVIIRPGERIPLDGIVIAGDSSVNQAPITGESRRVKKMVGDAVFAGAINEQGALEVRVTRTAGDSTIARIIRLVEQAQAQKAPAQAFVERFARYYTPVVVVGALLLAAIPPIVLDASFMDWFYRALVLLVISCPCALVISTPITIVSGLTNAARAGILIKGGIYLENFRRMKTLAFDKTGTLTVGRPQVQAIFPLNAYSEMELMSIAASIEARSEHPLAQAIVDFAAAKQVIEKPLDSFKAIPGKGVTARISGTTYYLGNHRLIEEIRKCDDETHRLHHTLEQAHHTTVILSSDAEVMGVFAVADGVRSGAQGAIRDLHANGVERIIMVTGDNRETAEAISRELGLDEFRAELLPEEKVDVIRQLKARHGLVAMIGDGINDAPALAAADTGISMGASGTDSALETADIALMNDDLGKLPYLNRLSRRTVRIIKQNIALALSLKLIFVGLAIPGLATLWMAVFADMGASLMVVFNGLRALKSANTPNHNR